MNIEFIKWKVGYARGWKYREGVKKWGEYKDTIISPDGSIRTHEDLELEEWRTMGVPLLLQSVIEGIETQHFKLGYSFSRVWKWQSKTWMYVIYKWGSIRHRTDDYTNIIDVKESALEYVFEKEREKE
jgi:hypothetical protein